MNGHNDFCGRNGEKLGSQVALCDERVVPVFEIGS